MWVCGIVGFEEGARGAAGWVVEMGGDGGCLVRWVEPDGMDVCTDGRAG